MDIKAILKIHLQQKFFKAFQFQYKTKLQELIKMKKKSEKQNLTDYNLLIVQDLWQAHYQTC